MRSWAWLAALIFSGSLPSLVAGQVPPPPVADGVYEGTISILTKNAAMQARDVPLRLEVQGSRVVGTFSYDVQRSPGRHNWMAWHCRLEGAFDPSGGVSGTVSGTRHMVSDGAERASPNARRTGSFTAQLADGRLVGAGEATTDESVFGSSTVSRAPLEFAVDMDSGESAPPGPRVALKAVIHLNPPRPKPGEQVSLWAEVTDGDGKPLKGAQTIWDVGNYGGNVDPRFTWDGKELLVKLTVVYDNNEYKFRRTIPAYEAGTASDEEAPASAPAAGEDGAKDWRPAAILGGLIVAVAAGVIGLAGVLIGRARRPALPRAPRPVTPRAPARRRAPARPPAPVAPPMPPRPPRPRPRVPAPPAPRVPPPPGTGPQEPPVTPSPGAGPPPTAPTAPTPPGPPVPPTPPQSPQDVTSPPGNEAALQAGLNALRDRLQQIIEARTKEGYYITNSSLVSKAWNEFPVLSAGRDWLTGYTGGTCGKAAEWGANWLPPAEVATIFGPGATYDTITIRNERLGGYAGDWINHIANRVILPDGRRYVVDFWEGLSTGQSGPAVISEAAWLARWTERCTLPGPRGGVDPMAITRSGAENALSDTIRNWGEQEGIRRYLLSARQTATKKGGDPRILIEAERTVRTYQKEPW